MSSGRINIYQMYMNNNYKFGFYVNRNSWRPVGHPKAGKIMGIRLVKIEADWLENGELIIRTGGNFSWTLVD